MPIIYHLVTPKSWAEAQEKGYYEAASLKEEGFIHCCEAGQIKGVIERYYSNVPDLHKLVIDTSKLTSQLIYDWSPSTQDTFPHIYGPIQLEAVIGIEAL